MVNITLMDQWDITHDHGDMVGIYVVFFEKKRTFHTFEKTTEKTMMIGMHLFFMIMNN
jgi:hypothetical protein